ncbi:hypothetical protein IL306_001627 [Fusarium sp. DS 682]|nr:hypothetical protein IL306_001627 [Fusarium sp. DS 682]
MGITGSGKSSFIKACSGKSVKIGKNLDSCTSDVDMYPYEMSPDRTVWLIDTPGFDDTNRSDSEVLELIARYLVKAYMKKDLLHGIIYLHRIIDVRMQGSAKTNLITFKQLCGNDALKRVVLATTMWDQVTSISEAEDRELELKQKPEFWGWMLSKGSSCYRYQNTSESAKEIVNSLCGHDQPVTTALQTQLVDERRTLDQTSAGQEVQGDLIREREKFEEKLRKLEKDMREARDLETQQIIQEERDRYKRLIEKVDSNTEALCASLEALLAERDQRIDDMEEKMKSQQAAHQEKIKQLERKQSQLEQEKGRLEKENDTVRQNEKERKRYREREHSHSTFQNDLDPQIQDTWVVKPGPKSRARKSIYIYPPYTIAIRSKVYLASSNSQIQM